MSGDHAAVVLAAGGSTRLGQPKQLLVHAGEPLVHRAVRLARDTRPAATLVVVGAHAEAVEAALADLDCTPLRNDRWRAGLSASLRVAAPAVLASGARRALVLVCDQPALEAAHLGALLEGADGTAVGCAATRYGAEGGIGVPAVVPAWWFADAAGGAQSDASADAPADASPDRGFGARLRALAAAADGRTGRPFLLDAPELGIDIDTPDDLRHLDAGHR